MKAIILLMSLTIGICATQLKSQTLIATTLTTNPNDIFYYDNKQMPHYGLQWSADSWYAGGNSAWLSGYGGIRFFTTGMSRMSIAPYGNVGIGTTAPRGTLDLTNTGTVFFKEIHFVSDDVGYGGDNSDHYTLRKVHDAINVSHLDLNLNDDADESFRILGNSCAGYGCGTYSGNLYHSFDVSGNVYHAGNVGIGTTTPTEKLSVNGNIRTQKVIVTQTGWPDYVFDSSYNLPSLESVSSFIRDNKHLPEMPTASSIEKDGHDLGEVQKLLLKKVEELTLYMIELKNENEYLRQVNKRIEKRFEQLEYKQN